MKPDLINTFVHLSVWGLLVIAYSVRFFVWGRAESDRVNHDGTSLLIGKGLKEMVYWGLQPVGKLLAFFRIKPNSVSLISLIFGLITGICFYYGHFGTAAVFAVICAFMDTLDGMVARFLGLVSDAGAVMDSSIDRYTEFFCLAGLALYYREMPVVLGIILLSLLGSFMVSYSSAKAEALGSTPPRGHMRRTDRAFCLIAGSVFSSISITLIEPNGIFPVPIGYPMVFSLILIAVFSNISAIERLIAVARSTKNSKQQLSTETGGDYANVT